MYTFRGDDWCAVVCCAPWRNRVLVGRLFCFAAQTPSVLNVYYFFLKLFFFKKINRSRLVFETIHNVGRTNLRLAFIKNK